MDAETARHRLMIHAGYVVDDDDDEPGLVGRLRPFDGIREGDVADLFEAVISIHPDVVSKPLVDRELGAALWEVCWRVRLLALRPDSGIRRNRLTDDATLEWLAGWIDAFESFATRMLRGFETARCAFHAVELIANAKIRDRRVFGFLVPLMTEMTTHPDPDVSETAAAARAVLTQDR